MKMHTQGTDELVSTLRKRVWRDWLVGGLFVIGMVVNVTALNSATRAALATPTKVSASVVADTCDANPDGGLLVAHRDGADERVTAAQ
jgi:hypothetical protein